MDCKGLVTKVDSFYGYFEVDDKYRIYLCLLKNSNDEIKLPQLYSMSESKKLHKSLNTFVACSSSTVMSKSKNITKSNYFTNLIKTNKLGAADVFIVDRALRIFEKNFSFENDITGKKVFSNLVETIIELNVSPGEIHNQRCLNKCLTNFSISSINSCKHVEINSSKYNDFPPWSFGVHKKPKTDNYLFGFVYVDPQYGFLMLKDNFHKIVCIFHGNEDIVENSFVLIKNYKIISEIYKEKKIPNLEYLLAHSEDVIIVHNNKKHLEMYGHVLPKKFKYTMDFIIIRKSTLCVGYSKTPETYLQIKIIKKKDDKIEDTIFLTLPSQYTIIVLHLKEGFKYRLHHNEPLREELNTELYSIEKLKNLTINEKDAYFEELEISDNELCTPVLKITDCKEYLSKNSNLFSFEGVIEQRGFVKNLSQKLLRTSLYGFSTPGKETHTLKFGYQENGNDSNVTVYLNDWLNRLMPLGLIPQMRVKLKHVQPKSTYIKSTIFTSIEIMSYDQTVDFHTANLFENHEIDWGPPYFLSKGNYIPQGVIVWSKVYNFHILELKMSNSCKECDIIVERSGKCSYCGRNETLFKFFMIMHVNDVFGISRIIVKDAKFLRIVLNLTEAQFSVWLEAFKSIGEFSFNIHEKNMQFSQMFDMNNFENVLSQYITTFNNSLSDNVELKCRKLVPKKNTKNVYPNWYYLDARRS
ncbi:uncharacterized protein LOC130892906 isoform X1 [Diorhabda carinulata]|uniref:uncharacterized protein LOC130892906 isoform X1 n=1 Tax=Diorhabda carinulata TaxID=1163345 RepID=UPI0025A261DE|nr:uncharacterized protein LOC130892906 isoform X1 [Diorhabda carinulata]